MEEILLKLKKEFMLQLTADWWVAQGLVLIKIIGIIIGVRIINRLGKAVIDKFLFAPERKVNFFDTTRSSTLAALLKSVLQYTLYFVAAIAILDLLGVQVAGILAGAGIVGLAVGFGAQNLVKDVITGFFILLEDQFRVGEYITTANVSGIVEELGLRVTKMRDFGGQLHIIPNGNITQVTNHNRGSMRALVDIGIAYEENIDEALLVLKQVAEKISSDYPEKIIEGPEVLGVQAFGPSEITLRVIAKTTPMDQWLIERELRKAIKEAFEAQGIEIPYPKQVFISNNNEKRSQEGGV